MIQIHILILLCAQGMGAFLMQSNIGVDSMHSALLWQCPFDCRRRAPGQSVCSSLLHKELGSYATSPEETLYVLETLLVLITKEAYRP